MPESNVNVGYGCQNEPRNCGCESGLFNGNGCQNEPRNCGCESGLFNGNGCGNGFGCGCGNSEILFFIIIFLLLFTNFGCCGCGR